MLPLPLIYRFYPILFTLATISLCHYAPSPPSPLLSFSVKDFGAVGDGIHYDTRPIQSAIDACSATRVQRCRVVFPPGKYLTATVQLKSHVTLDIRKNATVLGGTKIGDYPREQERWYVVLAEGQVDVGITGGGEINGQGLKFVKRWDERKNVMVSWNKTGACLGDECRPRLVGFVDCRDVRVWDVNLIEPAYWWCVHFFSDSDPCYSFIPSIFWHLPIQLFFFNLPNNYLLSVKWLQFFVHFSWTHPPGLFLGLIVEKDG